jgi:hypothetical protein
MKPTTDYREPQLAVSHLGYLPNSPKTLTFLPGSDLKLPETIEFFIRQNCFRMPRDAPVPKGFSERFTCHYDPLRGKLVPREGSYYRRGELRRRNSCWGSLWQADFGDFTTSGSYQIETDWQVSVPFAIQDRIYDRVIAGYLTFLQAQRCGYEMFGVHPACHLDDGLLDTDGASWPATGGWHDAGDFRKQIAFTLYHVDALATLHEMVRDKLTRGGIAPDHLREEIAWGNRLFHRIINGEGLVFEDVGGGGAPPGGGFTYERDWWMENHPGCYLDASDNRWTDNVCGSGDERTIRTTYNPLIQWAFVHVQSRASACLPPPAVHQCLDLAGQAAGYARVRGHDGRTLFVTAELRGNLELLAAGSPVADRRAVMELAGRLLDRQDCDGEGLNGYFMEANGTDAFRSIGFSADPALAFLRLWELRGVFGPDALHLVDRSIEAVRRYVEGYVLADAASNPFGLTPYGVYLNAPHPERQNFRDAGRGRGVRTFIHPFNRWGMVHGTGSVLMGHAHLLARAGRQLGMGLWQAAAERLLQWSLGHNTCNRSLFTGIGYRQPVGYSFRIPQLPEALMNGFTGRPDDSPYLEESTAIEWNSLEYWSIPYLHAAQAACWLQ